MPDVIVQDGVCKKTIDRSGEVQSITWFPKGEGIVFIIYFLAYYSTRFIAFLSVERKFGAVNEGSYVVKLVSFGPMITHGNWY